MKWMSAQRDDNWNNHGNELGDVLERRNEREILNDDERWSNNLSGLTERIHFRHSSIN